METTLTQNAVAEVLRKDHEIIKDLFRQIEGAANDRRKKILGDRCLRAIEDHGVLVEKIFYPALRRDLGEGRLVAQAMAEHAEARRVIEELKELPPGGRYNARLRALQEIVDSHIDEEETRMLPLVDRSDMDVEQLGAQLLEKKRRLASSGFQGGGFRRIAVAAAGVAIVGAAAWLARLSSARRVRP